MGPRLAPLAVMEMASRWLANLGGTA